MIREFCHRNGLPKDQLRLPSLWSIDSGQSHPDHLAFLCEDFDGIGIDDANDFAGEGAGGEEGEAKNDGEYSGRYMSRVLLHGSFLT